MSNHIDEGDLRRLSELEPDSDVVAGRVSSAVRRRRRRSRASLLGCLLVVVAVLGVGAWRLAPPSDAPRVEQPQVAPASTTPSDPAMLGNPELCAAPQPTLVIYMRVDASVDQIAAVQQWLSESAAIEEFHFVDQQAAYEEFTRLFADSPEMVASVRPEDLTSSFRIVAPEATALQLADGARGLPGVKASITDLCSRETTPAGP